jgi:UrcA family protein
MMMLIVLAAAAAQPSLQPVDALRTSVTVRYGDLVLATAEGQRELDRRIASAALRICTSDVPTIEQALYDIDGCVAKVVADSAQDRRRAIAAAGRETRTATIG